MYIILYNFTSENLVLPKTRNFCPTKISRYTISSNPEDLQNCMEELESDCSDDDFDGYIHDDDAELQERMNRDYELGGGLELESERGESWHNRGR